MLPTSEVQEMQDVSWLEINIGKLENYIPVCVCVVTIRTNLKDIWRYMKKKSFFSAEEVSLGATHHNPVILFGGA